MAFPVQLRSTVPSFVTNRCDRKPSARGSVALFVAAALGGGIAACADSGADSLMPGQTWSAQTSPDASGPIGSSNSPNFPSFDDAGTAPVDAAPAEPKGEQMFRALQSSLVATCGGTAGVCHVTGAFQGGTCPTWLGMPDPYISAKTYPGIITADPYSSKLLIKGPHEGPDFSGPNAMLGTQVTAWLTEEALEIVATALPATTPATLNIGPNVIDISQSAAGIPGATIAFVASITDQILTLSHLSIEAPTTAGLHIAHPVFAIVPPTGPIVPDPVDSMSNVDQTLLPAVSDVLGPGILVLENFAAGSQLEIEFNTLASVAPPSPADAGGGCKNVAAFTANAVPAIQANTCLTCHNTGGPGNSSLDLSQVGVNDTLACAQALTKVNLTTPSQSDIILAPTGMVAAHPFKTASSTYATMMLTWIATE